MHRQHTAPSWCWCWGLKDGPMGIPSTSPSGRTWEPPWSCQLVLWGGMPEVIWLLLLLSALWFSSSVGIFSRRVVLRLSAVLVSLVLWVWVWWEGWVQGVKVLGTGRMLLGMKGGCFWSTLFKKWGTGQGRLFLTISVMAQPLELHGELSPISMP